MEERTKILISKIILQILFLTPLFFIGYQEIWKGQKKDNTVNKQKKMEDVENNNDSRYSYFFRGQEYAYDMIVNSTSMGNTIQETFSVWKYLFVVMSFSFLLIIFDFFEGRFFKLNILTTVRDIFEIIFKVVSSLLKYLFNFFNLVFSENQ